jgi:Secretion system C-terminal sorting domain/Galactose oxidase, central domain/NHL repeat
MKKKLLLFFAIISTMAGGLIAQDSWMQKANFGGGNRYGTIHFSLGDKAYAGTGADDVTYKSDFWEFDPVTNVWTQKADFGGGIRAYATSFTIGNKGYAGTGAAGSYVWRKDMWEYSPDGNSWRRVADFDIGLPDVPGNGFRYGAVGFSIGNKGYMGTGNYRISPAYDAIYLNDFWEFDPSTGDSGTWTRKADVPEQGRCAAVGLSIGSKGYVGTGFYYYDTRKKDWWEYDPAADAWTRKADCSGTERYAAAAFTIGNKAYLGTGWNRGGLNDLWEFNPATNEWVQKASLPGEVRHVGTSFSLNNKGYIGLGLGSVGSLSDFWEYSASAELNPAVTFDPVYAGTFAGDGEAGFADSSGTAAEFFTPRGVATDGLGNVFVADAGNHRIRKITPGGDVSTFAGSGVPGLSDGKGNAAQFNYPAGIAFDSHGNLFIADENNHAIRKITSTGLVSTVAGNGTEGFNDGPGITAQFSRPAAVTADASGNLYVADFYNNRVRKITPAGIVSTFAGSGVQGTLDGTGAAAQFITPDGLAIDGQGNLYVSQFYGRLRKINTLGAVTTISTDPVGTYNTFHQRVAIDALSNIFLSIENNASSNMIFKIPQYGAGGIFAGTHRGYRDGIGAEARFDFPQGLSFDRAGNIYVADAGNNRIRKMTPPQLIFDASAGNVSAAQFFSVSGTTLSGNIAAEAPAGYEISQSSIGVYTATINISPVSGVINGSTVYIRLKSTLGAGTYNGNISLSADGALTKWLPVTGKVTDTAPPIIQSPPSRILCFNAGNNYSVPVITATDISGIRNITFSIGGATLRNGTGNDASGIFNAGMNIILWTVTDNAGNSSTCVATVRVDLPLTVSIPNTYPLPVWGKANTIYKGFGLTCAILVASASGGTVFPYSGYRYAWSTGSTTSVIRVCPATPGLHVYSVVITDSLGCTATASISIKVIDVRCGPNNNEVLVCWLGKYQNCYKPGQAVAALLFGAQLGSCNATAASANKTDSFAEDAFMQTGNEIKVFPNPNKGSFTIELNNFKATEVRVTDLSGKIIRQKMMNGLIKKTSVNIDLGPVACGMYLLQIVSKDAVNTCKIIVQY